MHCLLELDGLVDGDGEPIVLKETDDPEISGCLKPSGKDACEKTFNYIKCLHS